MRIPSFFVVIIARSHSHPSSSCNSLLPRISQSQRIWELFALPLFRGSPDLTDYPGFFLQNKESGEPESKIPREDEEEEPVKHK